MRPPTLFPPQERVTLLEVGLSIRWSTRVIIELGFSRIRADRSTTWRPDGVLAKDRHPGIRHDGLNRDSTRSAMEEMEGMREVQAG
jgi:hypothetical protein